MSLCEHPLSANRGFAIALLMWMIAGMSLLVTAVIHFAQDDIGLAEQRVSEAKSEALARGVALLVLRDAALAPFRQSEAAGDKSYGDGRDAEDEARRGEVFSRRYDLDGHTIQASVHPASGFVSLNGGGDEELRKLFSEIGGADEMESEALVMAVNDYRYQRDSISSAMSDFSGFRAREELLAVRGMRKSVYDRVKDYVQPYEGSTLNVPAAPSRLRSVFNEAKPSVEGLGGRQGMLKKQGAARGALPANDGLVTFESLNRQRAAALASNTVSAVLVDIELSSGVSTSYRVWVSKAQNIVIHAERVVAQLDGEGKDRG